MKKSILLLFLTAGLTAGAQNFENYYPYLERGLGSAVFNFDDGYAMVGFTFDEYHRSYLYILRTDLNGDTLWTKKTDIGYTDKYPFLSSYAKDADGNIYLAANYTDTADLIKLSPDWEIIWMKRYDPVITITNITLSKDNHLLISGIEEDSNYKLFKMDTDGEIIWHSVKLKYGYLEITSSPSIIEMEDKIILLTVLETNYTIEYKTTMVNVFDDGGDTISSVLFPGYALSDTYVSGGELLGLYYKTDGDKPSNGMIRFLSDGTILSDKVIKMPPSSIVSNFLPSDHDNFLAVGVNQIDDLYPETYQIIVFGINSAGDSLWTNFLGNSQDICPYDVKRCNDNGFVISGSSKNSGNWVPLLYKIDSYGNVNNLGINDKNIPSGFRAYPNPANEYVVIESLFIKNGIISVSDIYGCTVAQIPVTGEKTVWDAGGVAPGIYFYYLNNDKNFLSGKILIVK